MALRSNYYIPYDPANQRQGAPAGMLVLSSSHQGGGAADNLALGVVLGSVAWALELVLSLYTWSHAQMNLRKGRACGAVPMLPDPPMQDALTPFQGTTQPKWVHTAFTPKFSRLPDSALTIR